jgi:dTDP-4-dehydrorhamnose reductase
MRILVTGASGLLGLNLALEAAKDHLVFGTINNHAIRTDAFTVLQVNLLADGAVERLLEQTQPDWVIHCAALANLEDCEAHPDLAEQLNTHLPAKLAAHVARGGARLVHVSTDAVFDGQKGGYSEQDTPNPLSVYARTKLEGERGVAQADPQAIITRVNLFGWSPSGRRSLAEFFFNNLSAGNRVMGFTDVYFCPLLANDLAAIFLKMLHINLNGLYHVVSKECLSKYEFGVRLANQFDLDSSLIIPASVEQGGLAAARSPRLTLRVDRLAKALGEPPPDISSGMRRFFDLYQQGYPPRLRVMAGGIAPVEPG